MKNNLYHSVLAFVFALWLAAYFPKAGIAIYLIQIFVHLKNIINQIKK